jgi:hypothetical protein
LAASISDGGGKSNVPHAIHIQSDQEFIDEDGKSDVVVVARIAATSTSASSSTVLVFFPSCLVLLLIFLLLVFLLSKSRVLARIGGVAERNDNDRAASPIHDDVVLSLFG